MKFSTAAIFTSAVAAVSAVKVERTGPSDTTILQYALTLEHLEATFYRQALKKFSVHDFKAAGFPPVVRERFEAVRDQEAIHVATLSSVLAANHVAPTKVSPFLQCL